VVRVFDFPGCWDGVAVDSGDHRSHLVFADPSSGACPRRTFPVPRLRITVAYDLPAGQRFAIDSFEDQHRSPLTDHALLIFVWPDELMAQVVDCLNSGRACAAER
jgi:hypothetical protein